nr:MAG TPA: Repressor protein CI [Caudoviricetes sp.]
MYDLNILLERISKLCEENSLSINQMLKLASLAPSVVDNIKRGRIPSIDKIQTIATFFDCSIDYIVGRTERPALNSKAIPLPLTKTEEINKPNTKTIIIPFYRTPASAGTGSWLSDETPVEYTNVPKTEKTSSADFMLEVRGDSMQPKFFDGDRVLVKNSESICEGEIGVFILNGESYIKKIGRGELISLNPAYEPIKLAEYDDIRCAGKVIGTIEL